MHDNLHYLQYIFFLFFINTIIFYRVLFNDDDFTLEIN